MKKILLSVAFLFATFTGVNAQIALISENFENAAGWTPDTSWSVLDLTVEEGGQPRNWQIYNATSFAGNGFPTLNIASESFFAENPADPESALIPYDVDNLIMSPFVVVPVTDVQLILTLEAGALVAPESSISYQILAFTQEQAGSPEFEIEDSVVYSGTYTASTTSAEIISIDLSTNNFFGENLRIAIRHFGSTGLGYILADNVVLSSYATASTGDFSTSTFSIYPNPVKDVLNISNSNGAKINSLTIVDINGRTVKQINSNVSQINISDLNAGVYFVNINSTEGNLTKKIVKQ